MLDRKVILHKCRKYILFVNVEKPTEEGSWCIWGFWCESDWVCGLKTQNPDLKLPFVFSCFYWLPCVRPELTAVRCFLLVWDVDRSISAAAMNSWYKYFLPWNDSHQIWWFMIITKWDLAHFIHGNKVWEMNEKEEMKEMKASKDFLLQIFSLWSLKAGHAEHAQRWREGRWCTAPMKETGSYRWHRCYLT